ncbi:hypothetical protein LSCM1_03837 [Leishmania martiniquensis]|uniref:RRM domain-containing protein n=1 Tax=Leishmania martiniquensis TaxID=1580590 RepID=A0A836H998_9TRYP|nr:hypothetical protein LSCM1_03837 [Leishmania martiniquensis]
MSLQNLFVAKLPRNINDADLLHIFAEFSPSSAKIMLDASTGKSKGFGFVLFDEEEKGARAYKAMNRKMTRACGHSFTLVIYPSNHNGKIFIEESNALYIRNIPMSVGQERVERFLKTFGNLIYFAMREDHYGNPVWVVYAEYETIEDAKNALSKLHGNSTYFHGSAPILAKFEDSEDAKRERRRRRDGAQTHAPNSGCIFPPPHSHHESCASLQSAATALNGENSGTHSRVLSSNKIVEAKPSSRSTAAPRRGGTSGIGAAMLGSSLANAPPPPPLPQPFLSAMADVMKPTPTASFSMPPQLLQPTPGYCYTLGGSGQQIFIPTSSFPGSLPAYNFAPTAQSARLLLVNMPMQTTEAAVKPGLSGLNPTASATMVMENGHQYILAPDTVNMSCDSFTSQGSTLSPMLTGSQHKSFLSVNGSQATYTSCNSGSVSAFSPCHDAVYVEPPQIVLPLREGDEKPLGEAGAGDLSVDGSRVLAPQRVSVNRSLIAGTLGSRVVWPSH